MKVWIVGGDSYSQRYIAGVFSERQKAEEWMARENPKHHDSFDYKRYGWEYYSLEDEEGYEVDGE